MPIHMLLQLLFGGLGSTAAINGARALAGAVLPQGLKAAARGLAGSAAKASPRLAAAGNSVVQGASKLPVPVQASGKFVGRQLSGLPLGVTGAVGFGGGISALEMLTGQPEPPRLTADDVSVADAHAPFVQTGLDSLVPQGAGDVEQLLSVLQGGGSDEMDELLRQLRPTQDQGSLI